MLSGYLKSAVFFKHYITYKKATWLLYWEFNFRYLMLLTSHHAFLFKKINKNINKNTAYTAKKIMW